MISILIPTYNYNTLPLVEELQSQSILEKIVFEILVLDDASPINEITEINSKINQIENCFFDRNETNLGRGQNRNLLVSKAKYDWILLMDCDTFPKDKYYIKNYISSIKSNTEKAFFGGIIYDNRCPKEDEMLRWVFGKVREEVILSKRLANPYRSALISNIALHKQLLVSNPFSDAIYNYGYEDIVFILELKKKQIPIAHIENPTYHLNLEKSIIFLEKFHSSLQNLKYLLDSKIIDANDTSLTKTYFLLYKYKLARLYAFTFKMTKKILVINLLSKNPSVFVFDIYRLGYFCLLNST